MKNKTSQHYFRLTKRWLTRSAIVVIAFLFIISVALGFYIHTNYYNYVESKLTYISGDNLDIYFQDYLVNDSRFIQGAHAFINDFPDKSSVEVWIIDKYGKAVFSSTGFVVDEYYSIPEYESAVRSPENFSYWTGYSDSGEHLSSITKIIKNSDGKSFGALRFIVSLNYVDNQIRLIYLLVFFVFLLLISLILISGILFINSIIKPIRKINESASLIADGNFDVRIDHYLYNDEIGDLCITINNMAEKLMISDKIRNDFISTVSHELRTPLTAIKGWGETILQISDSDPILTQRGMNVIINESKRLNNIVDELLDFSAIQSGKLVLNIKKIDVLAELDETVFAFRDRAIREGKELIYKAPNVPAPMDADPDRIKQIFVNLIDNALKYTEQGGKITVNVEILDDNIIISVSDTGCGISEEDLIHVKEKFYKTNMTVRGSGIGLSVVDEIIKLHNGKLDIESELNVGTTVRVEFKIDHVDLEQTGILTKPLEHIINNDNSGETNGEKN